MRRRDFIAGTVSSAAWPTGSRSQSTNVLPRVGILDPGAPPDVTEAFVARMAQLGWIDKKTITYVSRTTGGDLHRADTLASELASLSPAVIWCIGSPVFALKRATSTIPIVFVSVGDPVSSGLVASLARPGANITGFAQWEEQIAGKWVELLKEIAPQVARAALLMDTSPAQIPMRDAGIAAASKLGIAVAPILLHDASEIEPSLAAAVSKEPLQGLIVQPGAITASNRERIVSLAAKYRLAAVYPYQEYVRDGGLIAYSTDTIDQARKAAAYVDRILKGTNASELPVQLPTKFTLSINGKTAKALDLTIPTTLLATADEVIE